jgi:hypothetical protein
MKPRHPLRLLCLLLLVAACDQREVRHAPADQASVTDLTNPYFAVAIQQDGRKVPIREHTVVLRREAFDVLVALPTPGGVFVNASTSPDLARYARDNRRVDDRVALEAFSEEPSSILTLADRGFAYWYYMGPGISKFTDVRVLGHPQRGRTWVCKKSLTHWRDGNGPAVKLEHLSADQLYLVFVKADWEGQRRVEQAHEWLRVVFR